MIVIKFLLKILAWIIGAAIGIAALALGIIFAGYMILYFLGFIFAVAIIVLLIFGLVKLFG